MNILTYVTLFFFLSMMLPVSTLGWDVRLIRPPADEEGSGVPPSEPTMRVVECQLAGKVAGEQLITGTNSMGGFALGLFLGPIGTVLTQVVQSAPDVPYEALQSISDQSGACQLAYKDAYMKSGKRKKKRSALHGGIFGTAIFAGIVALVILTKDQPATPLFPE